MIPRSQKGLLKDKIISNRLILVQGPKRVGKQTLLLEVIDELNFPFCVIDLNDKDLKAEVEKGIDFFGEKPKVVILLDAQYLNNLNELVEAVLMNKIKSTLVFCCSFTPNIESDYLEALRIEKSIIRLLPPCFHESAKHFGLPNEEQILEERLIFGCYPEVSENLELAESKLQEIIQDAIFTRLSESERINKGEKLMTLLRALAFNIGEAVSYNELAIQSDLDNETVQRYISLLEDAFILFRLPSYHNDNRYELKKSNTIYFVDNGIRKALIRNFNPTYLRNDMNALWLNYVISERLKLLQLNDVKFSAFFWKTHTNQQVDYIEVVQNKVGAYCFDWEKRGRVRVPVRFKKLYPSIKCKIINRSSYWSLLSQKEKP